MSLRLIDYVEMHIKNVYGLSIKDYFGSDVNIVKAKGRDLRILTCALVRGKFDNKPHLRALDSIEATVLHISNFDKCTVIEVCLDMRMGINSEVFVVTEKDVYKVVRRWRKKKNNVQKFSMG